MNQLVAMPIPPTAAARRSAPLWASGQIAVQIFRDVPSLLLLFYMTQLLKIPPAMAGAAIFVPKLFWAVLCDLGAGVLSDRWRGRFARRNWLLVGALLAPLALILLFAGSDAPSAGGRALHVSLVLAVYMLVFAVFSVPHLAIGTELSDDPATATVAMGWRVAFAGVGLLIGASGAPYAIGWLGADAAAYRTVAIILGGCASAALVVSWLGSREVHTPARARTGFAAARRAAFGNRRLLLLLLVLLVQLTGSGLSYATLAYLFSFNLAYADPLAVLGGFVLATAITAIAVQPVWVAIANRIGKPYGLALASMLFGLTLLSVLLLPRGETLPAYVVGVMFGLFNSGCYLNIYALLADLVSEERAGGGAHAGLYASLFTAADKIAFALGGTLIAGALLGAAGFDPAAPVQDEAAQRGIAFAFALLPAGLFFATALIAGLALNRR